MFIPYANDAPWHRPPWVTFSLIGLNTVLFLLQDRLVPESIYLLEFGNGLHPIQWLWNAFAHANACHLAGNMIFLYVFGTVVESRMKPLRFLILYVSTAATEGLLMQSLQLSGSGGTLGASGVICGLMLVACLVKPDCQVSWFVVIWYRVYDFETPVLIAGLYYFLVDFGMALLVDFQISTPVLHMVGGLIGLAWGLVALRVGWFRYDGKDCISRFKELLGKPPAQPVPPFATDEPESVASPPRVTKFGTLQSVVSKFEEYLQQQRYQLALMKLGHIREISAAFQLNDHQLVKLINLGMTQQDWPRVANWLGLYLEHHPAQRNEILIKKTHIENTKLENTSQANETFRQIDPSTLAVSQLRRYQRLKESLQAARSQGSPSRPVPSPP